MSGRLWDGQSSAMEVAERLGYYEDYCGLRRDRFEPEEREDDNDDEQEDQE